MIANAKKIVKKIILSVEGKLPLNDIINANKLFISGEWEEAFLIICAQLYEYDVIVSKETLNLIEDAASQMKIDEREWAFLKPVAGTPPAE